MLNENNLPYRVENESQFFANRYQDIFYNLNNLSLRPGDIIFLCLQNLMPFTIPFIDISKIFDEFSGREKIFCDSSHINELGYKILAEKLFTFLTANNFFQDKEFNYPPPPPVITDTVYRRSLNRAAQKISSTKSWRLTKKFCARKKFKSARSS